MTYGGPARPAALAREPMGDGPARAGAPRPRSRPPPGEPPGSTRRLLRNSTLNLAGQVLNAAANLAVFVVLARALSVEGLGEYYTLFALVMVLQRLLEAGTSTVLTRRVALDPGRWREVAAEAAVLLVLAVLASLAVFFVLGLGWASFRPGPAVVPAFVAAGLACAALHVQEFCAGVLRAFESFGAESLARIVQGGLYVVLVVGLVWHGTAGLATVAVAFALSQVAAALLLAAVLLGGWGRFRWRCCWSALPGWLREAIPLGLGDMLRHPGWQLDTVLLGFLQPPAVAGVYSVAYRPHTPLVWVPRSVLGAAFPSVARLGAAGPGSLAEAFARSLRLLWVVGLPLAILVCIWAEPLVLVLAGRNYLEAALPMRLLIWKTALMFLSTQFRFFFAAAGKLRAFARLVLLAFGLEAVLMLALIPHWGYLGACAGTLIGEVAFTAAGLVVCARIGIGRPDWKALAAALPAGAAMAAVLWAGSRGSTWLLPLVGIAAVAVYLLACVIFGALRRNELRHIRQLM